MGYIADSTINTFHPLTVFNYQTDNAFFMLKEAMRQEEKLEFVRAMEK